MTTIASIMNGVVIPVIVTGSASHDGRRNARARSRSARTTTTAVDIIGQTRITECHPITRLTP